MPIHQERAIQMWVPIGCCAKRSRGPGCRTRCRLRPWCCVACPVFEGVLGVGHETWSAAGVASVDLGQFSLLARVLGPIFGHWGSFTATAFGHKIAVGA